MHNIIYNTYEDYIKGIAQIQEPIHIKADDLYQLLLDNKDKCIYLGKIIVEGVLNLKDVTFTHWFNCGHATFKDYFSCGHATFEDCFYCECATFKDVFDYRSATFEKGFDCGSATFEKGFNTQGKKLTDIRFVYKCGKHNRTVGLFVLDGANYLRIGCQFDTFDTIRTMVVEKYGLDSDYVKKIDSLLV